MEAGGVERPPVVFRLSSSGTSSWRMPHGTEGASTKAKGGDAALSKSRHAAFYRQPRPACGRVQIRQPNRVNRVVGACRDGPSKLSDRQARLKTTSRI